MNRYELQEAFQRGDCKEHVNSLQIFYDEHKYYLVTKTFSHKKERSSFGNLLLRITKFEPSCTHTKAAGKLTELHRYAYPKIKNDVCLGASLISVIQWEDNIYYWKVRDNPVGKNGDTLANSMFTLVRFNFKKEREEKIHEYLFNWSTDHKHAFEKCMKDHKHNSPGGAGSPCKHEDEEPGSPEIKPDKNYALSAIFVNKSDAMHFETEQEFLDS